MGKNEELAKAVVGGLLCLAMGIGITILGFSMFEDTMVGGALMFFLGVSSVFAGFASLGNAAEISKTNKEKKEINKKIKKGKWEFPCEEFYNKCKAAGITSFDDEFSIKKAQKFVTEILSENNVDEKNYHLFIEPKKMKELYYNGPKHKEKRIQFEKEEKNKEILKQKEIKVVKPNEENAKLVKQYAELVILKGTQKREKMLSFVTEKKREKYKHICEYKNSVDKYSDHLYYKAEHNDSNWAIAGGIAEGLAGTGAGVAAAIDAMSKEPQIQEDNRILKQSALELKYTSMTQLSRMVDNAEWEYNKALNEEKTAKDKIVLDRPGGKEISTNIRTHKTNIKKLDDGVLKISTEIFLNNPLKLFVPKGTKMVIDGILSGKVFYEGKFVDEVKLVLPTYGITNDSKDTATATGYCTKSAEYPGEYTLEITDMTNLWIMEY